MESKPIAQLLGVYKINGASDVHLLEFIFNISPTDIDVSSFTQEDDKLPKDSWQTAYDERFLNHDGTDYFATSVPPVSPNGAGCSRQSYREYRFGYRPGWQGGIQFCGEPQLCLA